MNNLFGWESYHIGNKPIRLIELFAGVGSQAMALRNINANFEHYRVVEFDKYAIASYNAIHNTNFPAIDITKINGDALGITETQKYEYILTYSFPCTDLSLAGRGLARKDGLKKGSSTRSGLLWEVERLLNECQELPQILLMENVPQVATTEGFTDWIDFLNSKGYKSFYKILNAKDYGVAQNRERCFMFSFLSNDELDYTFPAPQKLTKVIRDYLEPTVDEKYYINTEKAAKLIIDLQSKNKLPVITEQNRTEQNRTEKRFQFGVDLSIQSAGIKEISNTIRARYDSGITNHQSENTGILELYSK